MNFKQLEFDPDNSKECDFCFRGEFDLILEKGLDGEVLAMFEGDECLIWCEDCRQNSATVILAHPVVEHGVNQ
jgi:hypothetical protein